MLTHLCTSCEWGPWNGYFTYNNNNKCQIIIILLLIMYIFILCSSTSCVLTWYFFFFFFLNTIFDTHTDQSQTLANFTHSIIWSIKIHIQVRFAFISSNHPSFFAAKKKKQPQKTCVMSPQNRCVLLLIFHHSCLIFNKPWWRTAMTGQCHCDTPYQCKSSARHSLANIQSY